MSYRSLTLCALVFAPGLPHPATPAPHVVRVVRTKRARRKKHAGSHAVTRPSQASGALCPFLTVVMEHHSPCAAR